MDVHFNAESPYICPRVLVGMNSVSAFMDLLTTLLIAVGLAMDAFAVSVAHGMSSRNLRSSAILKMAMSFGLFQAFMPVIGWLAGVSLAEVISGVDHWIAFGLLCVVGGKMIHDSRNAGSDKKSAGALALAALLVLSVATSIDALAVGLSFAFLQVAIIAPVIVIGTVTFLLSFVGVSFGNKLGSLFSGKVEVAGGLILIGIGIKILLEHLS